jgi:hypothetical protein
MNKIVLIAIMLLFVSCALTSPRVGKRPDGICTTDINIWGHASQCSCDEDQVYDERAGLCLEGIKGEKITAQGAISANMAAIGGETTGIEIKTQKAGSYELILKVPDQEKLKELEGMSFEVVGEIIIIESIERKGRQAIIVDRLAVLE